MTTFELVWRILAIGLVALGCQTALATEEVGRFEFSRAGYWTVPGSPRRVTSFNLGWEFSLDGFKTCKAVSLPHGIDEGELLPQASGCVNRQQAAWYRKRFSWHRTSAKSFLHFEAVMGKCRVTVNGRVAAEHFGGYLPIHVDVTDLLKDGENEVVVWCDNSDDPSYPPGKPQRDLDFAYFGGIYRDVWLVETGPAYVTDSDRGGVFVRTRPQDGGKWEVAVDAAVEKGEGDEVRFRCDGRPVVPPFVLDRPMLWTPDEPNLHDLDVEVLHGGQVSDAVRVRFGVRELKITGEGLFVNGRKWRKLVGVNRHQDYLYLGNALANSLHWRDAKKYRDAGFTAIRNAHYPQDPAFMDACDALGLLVIVTTPGWQFWNEKEPKFAARVYDDIAKMCRRDRSRASLLMWEPILNETRFPADFAARARAIVKAETRGTDGVCACDRTSAGSDDYDVVYTACTVTNAYGAARPTFIREWGDFPDDWSAQNSPSRAAREWGEQGMLNQADHYLNGHCGWASLKSILAAPDAMLGGCLWHGADHARGYHPDNFFGGVLTYGRRKKYSWHMFKAGLTEKPYVFVANALEPYSPRTVTIYSNCAYTASWYGKPFAGGMEISEEDRRNHEDAYFYEHKLSLEFVSLALTRADGVKSVLPWARRFSGVRLSLDTEGLDPVADGSDEVAVVAELVDEHGNTRHYQTETVEFAVEGPADLIGERRQVTRFGEAEVVLRLRAREKPEPIRITCELVRKGRHVPRGARYVFTPGTHVGEGCEPLAVVTDESRQVGLDQNAFGEGQKK